MPTIMQVESKSDSSFLGATPAAGLAKSGTSILIALIFSFYSCIQRVSQHPIPYQALLNQRPDAVRDLVTGFQKLPAAPAHFNQQVHLMLEWKFRIFEIVQMERLAPQILSQVKC